MLGIDEIKQLIAREISKAKLDAEIATLVLLRDVLSEKIEALAKERLELN